MMLEPSSLRRMFGAVLDEIFRIIVCPPVGHLSTTEGHQGNSYPRLPSVPSLAAPRGWAILWDPMQCKKVARIGV